MTQSKDLSNKVPAQSSSRKEEKSISARADFARALRGKYAHVPTSREEFARRKQDEIERDLNK